MSNMTSVRPTVLGDSLRRIAEILDGAPSILTAADTSQYLSILLVSPDAVRKIGEDLGFVVNTYGTERQFTSFHVRVGSVEAKVFAEHAPVRELRRPTVVTDQIEEQEQ